MSDDIVDRLRLSIEEVEVPLDVTRWSSGKPGVWVMLQKRPERERREEAALAIERLREVGGRLRDAYYSNYGHTPLVREWDEINE